MFVRARFPETIGCTVNKINAYVRRTRVPGMQLERRYFSPGPDNAREQSLYKRRLLVCKHRVHGRAQYACFAKDFVLFFSSRPAGNARNFVRPRSVLTSLERASGRPAAVPCTCEFFMIINNYSHFCSAIARKYAETNPLAASKPFCYRIVFCSVRVHSSSSTALHVTKLNKLLKFSHFLLQQQG